MLLLQWLSTTKFAAHCARNQLCSHVGLRSHRTCDAGMSALGQKRTHAVQQRMSALGQKQTYAVHNGASALPPKATSNGPSGRQFKPPHTLPIVFPAHNSGKIVFEKRPIYLAKMNAAAPSTSVAQFDIGLFD